MGRVVWWEPAVAESTVRSAKKLGKSVDFVVDGDKVRYIEDGLKYFWVCYVDAPYTKEEMEALRDLCRAKYL